MQVLLSFSKDDILGSPSLSHTLPKFLLFLLPHSSPIRLGSGELSYSYSLTPKRNSSEVEKDERWQRSNPGTVGKGCCRHKGQHPKAQHSPPLRGLGAVQWYTATTGVTSFPISKRQSRNSSGRTVAEHFLVNHAVPRGYPVLSNSTNT